MHILIDINQYENYVSVDLERFFGQKSRNEKWKDKDIKQKDKEKSKENFSLKTKVKSLWQQKPGKWHPDNYNLDTNVCSFATKIFIFEEKS
jgi:succinylglutamate desuccinylase